MFIASGALYARQTGILTKKNRRRSVWLAIGIDLELRNQAALAKNTRFKRKRSFIHPRFQGAKAQLRLRRTRALKTNLRFFRLLIPPQRSEGGMGVQRDVGGTGACRTQWAIQAGGTSGIARSDGTSRLCEFPGTSEYSPLILLGPAQRAACRNP